MRYLNFSLASLAILTPSACVCLKPLDLWTGEHAAKGCLHDYIECVQKYEEARGKHQNEIEESAQHAPQLDPHLFGLKEESSSLYDAYHRARQWEAFRSLSWRAEQHWRKRVIESRESGVFGYGKTRPDFEAYLTKEVL